MHEERKPKVSIVIPTCNNGKKLSNCLKSIDQQKYEKIETIVVDCWSADNTLNHCKKWDAKVISLDSGRAEARQVGSQVATGEILVHIDSDMILPPDVVSELVDVFNQGYRSAIIPERNLSNNPWGQAKDIGKVISNQRDEGNLRATDSKLYHEVGGHNRNLTAKEDKDLHDKITAVSSSIATTETPIIHDIRGRGLIQILRTQYSYADSMESYYETADKAEERGKDSLKTHLDRYKYIPRLLVRRRRDTILYIFLNIVNMAIVRCRRFRPISEN